MILTILTIMMMMMTRYVVPIVVTQERVTATSISQMLNNVGQGVNIIMIILAEVKYFATL